MHILNKQKEMNCWHVSEVSPRGYGNMATSVTETDSLIKTM